MNCLYADENVIPYFCYSTFNYSKDICFFTVNFTLISHFSFFLFFPLYSLLENYILCNRRIQWFDLFFQEFNQSRLNLPLLEFYKHNFLKFPKKKVGHTAVTPNPLLHFLTVVYPDIINVPPPLPSVTLPFRSSDLSEKRGKGVEKERTCNLL